MGSQVHKRGPVSPTLNLTPLIDVTFLLIIFFMLVNNIITEESVLMHVPELDNPQTQPFDSEYRLTINLAPAPYEP